MNVVVTLGNSAVDTWVIAKRNLLRYLRLPRLLFFSSIQPIIFLTLFNFVFGGAIGGEVPGGKYINYLLPGILVQTTLFGALNTGVGLAEDMGRGIVDRFRSLPMSRAAVMAGRTVSDMLRNVVVIAIMLSMGAIYGFRFQDGFLNAILMILLVLAFSFAFSWVAAYIGLTVGDTETAQLAGFVIIFPLTFASAAFVPVESMASWLQVFARNQPITFAVDAARQLALGIPSNGAIWKLLLWILGILAVFIPLSIWRYRTRT
ncbi:ABC transporter permease [Candidatus Saccharibacteria bacterium]|nr:ABC transporter permease [Candidatus Saccharibacteria bacterium]